MEHLLNKKPLLFIGGINLKNNAEGGEEAKNQQLIHFFKRHKLPVIVIDTHNWKKRLIPLLFQIIKHTFFSKKQAILLSLSYGSVSKLLRFFKAFKVYKKSPIYYMVIGGKFHNWIKANPKQVKVFNTLKYIYPESVTMVQTLNKCGLLNTKQLPNFKTIPKLNIDKHYNEIKFVFLSRLVPTKGVDLIIEATKMLNKKHLNTPFSVSFYGNFDDIDSPGYKNTFLKQINAVDNITYKGFLKLNDVENYNTLANYNAMLFPTFWKGEGYPGVLIDAFIAQLPIIASDWHHNKEIVFNAKNGLLIQAKNVDALANAMEQLITDKAYLTTLEQGTLESVKKFDIDYLLPPIFETIYN